MRIALAIAAIVLLVIVIMGASGFIVGRDILCRITGQSCDGYTPRPQSFGDARA